MTYFDDDIAVVGAGCVFPDAPHPEAFWERIREGTPSLRSAPEDRWPRATFEGEGDDKTYSSLGAYVPQAEVDRLAQSFSLKFSETNRLQLFAMESARQALKDVPLPLRQKLKSGIFLGCLGPDDQFSLHKFLLEEASLRAHVATLEGPLRQRAERLLDATFKRVRSERSDPLGLILTTQCLQRIQERFSLKGGETCLVDAACASSLAAMDVAVKKLRARQCDLALTGGVETELPPEQFVLFAKLGLMARQAPFPLDDRTDGVTQGEGAAVFALMRVKDARAHGLPLWGVVRGCGGSSNGRGASLFQPTSQGQRLALERAYGDRKPKRLDWLECHATGTRLGDKTEIETVDSFFSGAHPSIPLGSVKALIGHAKGAAGAAGFLKALLALRNRVAPPSPYFQGYIGGLQPTAVHVNRAPESMAPDQGEWHAGVSSAGFGGTNYHAFVSLAAAPPKLEERAPLAPPPMVALAAAYVPREGAREIFPSYGFRIPPNHLRQIDLAQLTSLMAVAEAWDRAGIDPETLDRSRVSVLSSASLGLEAWLSCRVRHFEFTRDGAGDPEAVQALLRHQGAYPAITEDAGPGTLNNVIAGRVANQFDFTGTNFHVDADLNSFACALGVAQLELAAGSSDYVVVLGIEDEVDRGIPDVRKGGAHCLILVREEGAPQPGLFRVNEVRFG